MAVVKVLQIVGFKNSGKTTLMLELLKQATHRGMTVSTVKHHGHGGALEMPPNDTDSMRFFQEGASGSIVYGDGVVQVHHRKKQAALPELVALASAENPDIVLVEGFKEASYEKIVLLRSAQDWLELQHMEHIALVIAPDALTLDNVPVILQNDSKQLNFWFTNWMDGDSNEGI